MKLKKFKLGDILFVLLLGLLLIPQTRKPIQIFISKGLALITPTIFKDKAAERLSTYNWLLINEKGVEYNFKEAKGKVVVINSWATWCPPCIAEMKSMENLYNSFKENNDVVFLFITSDSFTKTTAFKEKHGYTIPIYNILTEYPEDLTPHHIPKTTIISKDGKIVLSKTGSDKWDSKKVINKINKLLLEQ